MMGKLTDTRNSVAQVLPRRQLLKGALIGAGGALAALSLPTTALAKDDDDHGLEGSWRETIHAPGGFSFEVLAAVAKGGSAVGTGSIDSTPGFKSSPAVAAWKRTGDRHFKVTALAFGFADTTGTLNGMYHIEESITLSANGDAYTASGSFRLDGMNGGPSIPTTAFTSNAARIKA
jgi:hypothetical protein